MASNDKISVNLPILSETFPLKLRSPIISNAECFYDFRRDEENNELQKSPPKHKVDPGLQWKEATILVMQRSSTPNQNWLQNKYDGRVEFAVVPTEGPDEGKPVGWTGIHSIHAKSGDDQDEKVSGTPLQGDIHCTLQKNYRGRYWDTECLELVSRFAFEDIKDVDVGATKCYMQLLIVKIHKENRAMIRIVDNAEWGKLIEITDPNSLGFVEFKFEKADSGEM